MKWPSLPGLPKLPDLPSMGRRAALPKAPATAAPKPPAALDPLEAARAEMQQSGVTATLPEWMVYRWLLAHGLREVGDFVFQSSQLGGRIHLGGAVADFTLPHLVGAAGLALRVQGLYWHYSTQDEIDKGVTQKAALEAQGWTVIDLDEDDCYERLDYIMQEALKGVDHSRLTREGR